jgi:hypothetical protein
MVGILYGIQHWPGAMIPLIAGILIEVTCNALILVEIANSEKAKKAVKSFWFIQHLLASILAYYFFATLPSLFLFFTGGIIYLYHGRKRFIPSRLDILRKQFDSI